MGKKIYTSKSSVKVYGDNDKDVIKQAQIRTILNYTTIGMERFYNYWVREMFLTKGMMLAYYRYAEQGHYPHGLPSFSVHGVSYDYAAISAALDIEIGVPCTVLFAEENELTIDSYWHWVLQEAPWYYQPAIDQITYDGKTDWSLTQILFNEDADPTEEYQMDLVRTEKDVSFRIVGPPTAVEGTVRTYTIYSNVYMPRGSTVTITLLYGGTIAAGRYSAPLTVDITELANKVSFDITFIEDAVDDNSETLIVTIDSIVDNTPIFLTVLPYAPLSSITTTVHDNDPLVLGAESQIIPENNLVTITIPVTLSDAAPGAFTVDYIAIDGTAIDAIDYNLSPGTLNFVGTANEVQNIVVSWIGSVPDEETKTFTVQLSNCSEPTVELIADTPIIVTASIGPIIPVTEGPPIEELKISLGDPNIDFDKQYLRVKYQEDVYLPGIWYWWLYDYDDGTYLDLEAVLSTNYINDMYPAAIIRQQKEFINVDIETEIYRTTRQLLKRIQMDINEISENVATQDGYEDIDDVFVNFAFSPHDDHPLISKLLYRHFYLLIHDFNMVSNTGEYRTQFDEQDANNQTKWYDQELTEGIIGVKGDVGTYSHEVKVLFYKMEEAQDESYVPVYSEWLYIYYQVTETTYDEIKLRDLKSQSKVSYGGKSRYLFNGLLSDAPAYMTIPLSRALVEANLDYKEQMTIYQHLFRIDVYSIIEVKTKWYDSPAFKVLFIFIAVVVTIITLGAGATIWLVIQQMVINALILRLVVYVAEATGSVELAIIVGIIAVIITGQMGFESFSIGTADALTTSVTMFTNILTSASQGAMKSLDQDLQDIKDETEKILDDTKDMDLWDDGVHGEYYRNILRSVDSTMYQARDAQYDFDSMLSGAYDRLITNYHDGLLRTGVV